jgi:hypothetical protein
MRDVVFWAHMLRYVCVLNFEDWIANDAGREVCGWALAANSK